MLYYSNKLKLLLSEAKGTIMNKVIHFLDHYTVVELRSILLGALAPFQPKWIYLFGSAALKQDHAHSDLDFAFYSDAEHDSIDVFMRAQQLSSRFHRELDLIQLRSSSTVFQKEVLVSSLLIYEADQSARELFESIVLKKYARLNEERMPILKQYISGSGHD